MPMPQRKRAANPTTKHPTVNMAVWAIGDIQGCLAPLKALIAQVQTQDPGARFCLCGDLVNRGPDSLATLLYLQDLQAQGVVVHTVLGNHDLFALACAAGFKKPKEKDTLTQLLSAPALWVDWLRQQPVAWHEHGFLVTHAGVWPRWDVAQTLSLADEVNTALRAKNWAKQLHTLWDGHARLWSNDLNALERQRFTINALMRMRYIAPDGGLDFDIKDDADNAPKGYTPWFDAHPAAAREAILVFGHWSALGLMNTPRIIALDTGCVWGRQLTAIKLHPDLQQRTVIQVAGI